MGRELCCVYEGKRYIVGYREGGTVAQKFAMWNPADIGGIATVDAPPVQQSYIDAAAQSLCPRLHNYVGRSLQPQHQKERHSHASLVHRQQGCFRPSRSTALAACQLR